MLFSSVLMAVLLAFARASEEFPVEKTETLQKSFRFALPDSPEPMGRGGGAPRHERNEVEVEIDNFQGSIEVVGYEGRTAELVVHQSYRARSEERLDRARTEVKLIATQTGNRVRLFVDGPFRCTDGSVSYRGREHYGYEVDFDFSLRVPTATNLRLKTVNDGEIRVASVSGTFDVENVNGGIAMTGTAGSGRAYALNGGVDVVFVKNPDADTYFGSLNGDVSVVLRPDLAAKLMVKTFNGDVYTDYPVSYLKELPPLAVVERRGKKVYKSSGFYGLQVGEGGPAIKFDAFNGDIRILKRGLTGEGR